MTPKDNIHLSGFDLDPAEMAIVQNIVNNYAEKIKEKINYQEMRLRLKKSRHGKAFLHEIQGMLIAENKKFNTKTSDYNLFAAVSGAFEKLLNETIHKKRTYKDEK